MSTQKRSPRSRPAWQVLYQALGVFSVVSVLTAVGLNTAILNNYRDSVDQAHTWADRSAAYGGLGRIATLGNGPGNDVFENKDIPGERAKLEAITQDWDQAYAAACADVQAHVPLVDRAPLLEHLATAHTSFQAMIQSSRGIFAAFERGDVEGAGSLMAQMDRQLGDTSEALANLNGQVQGLQSAMFAEQLGGADRMQLGAYALVGLLALMVVGVIAYGKKLAALFAAAQAEIDRRSREVALLLENVDQGLVTVDTAGKMSTERSAAFAALFGSTVTSGLFRDQLQAVSPGAEVWFDMTYESLVEGFMPDELLVTQFPQGFVRDGRHVALSYRALRKDGALTGLLVIATDVTAAVARAEAEQSQRQTMALFERIAKDRLSVVEFIAEADRIVRSMEAATEDLATEKRLLHTLKGNAGFYGLTAVVNTAHSLETGIAEEGRPPSAADRARLTAAWEAVRATARHLLGDRVSGIEIADQELEAILKAVLERRPHAEIAAQINALKLEPVSRRFERIAEQARALCKRLGKGDVRIVVDHANLRGAPERTAPFWGSLVHIVRNSIDHGYEDEATRIAAGKPAQMTLEMRARTNQDRVIIEIADDGAGIAWDKLQRKAKERNLRLVRDDEPQELLFADGLSTRDEVTELSGRGVGMGAVRAEVEELGGAVQVQSEAGQGTVVTFTIPNNSWAGTQVLRCA
jgi:HPt (histidine-containing phosphotransfer) domain-containing protein/two-component sensor histidine kinase